MGVPPPVRRVRAVVLTQGAHDHLVASVRALCEAEWPDGDLDVVVVDNASTGDVVARAAAVDPRVRVIRNDLNTGFPANNLAMRDLAGVDAVALVNDDAFVEPRFVRSLASALDGDAGLGAVAAKLVLADRFVEVSVRSAAVADRWRGGLPLGVQLRGARCEGASGWRSAHPARGLWAPEADDRGDLRWTDGDAVVRVPVGPPGTPTPRTLELLLSSPTPRPVQLEAGGALVEATVGPLPVPVAVPVGSEPIDVVNNAGVVVDDLAYGADRGGWEPDGPPWDDPAEVFAFSGGAVLLRAAFLADVGGFDEALFAYYEDVDLAWRGRRRGWRYRYEPTAVARHVHAATSGGSSSRRFRVLNDRNRILVALGNGSRALVARVALDLARDSARRVVLAGAATVGVRHQPGVHPVGERLEALRSAAALAPHALGRRRDRGTLPRRRVESLLVGSAPTGARR